MKTFIIKTLMAIALSCIILMFEEYFQLVGDIFIAAMCVNIVDRAYKVIYESN